MCIECVRKKFSFTSRPSLEWWSYFPQPFNPFPLWKHILEKRNEEGQKMIFISNSIIRINEGNLEKWPDLFEKDRKIPVSFIFDSTSSSSLLPSFLFSSAVFLLYFRYSPFHKILFFTLSVPSQDSLFSFPLNFPSSRWKVFFLVFVLFSLMFFLRLNTKCHFLSVWLLPSRCLDRKIPKKGNVDTFLQRRQGQLLHLHTK